MRTKNLAASSNRASSTLVPANGAKTCILVLGMHRSGTSALTRVISLLGATLPARLMPARPGDNETGFWEPRDLWALNDRLLAEAGSRWDDWRPVDLSALPPDRIEHFRREIRSMMVTDYGNAQVIVLKEPRICRLATFYLELLSDIGYHCHCVVALRDPAGVIASLRRRNGMTDGFAALLWLRHMLEAETATRAMPRLTVSYDALLNDRENTLEALRSGLPFVAPRSDSEGRSEIERFLSADLRHSAPDWRELDLSAEIRGWLERTYEALLRLERHEQDSWAADTLDDVRRAFDAVSDAFGAALFDELSARQATFESERSQLVGALDEKEQEIGRLAPELEKRQRVIDELAGECENRLRIAEDRAATIHRLADELRKHDTLNVDAGAGIEFAEPIGAVAHDRS